MNPYLTHQMALSNQRELHRKAERARVASGAISHSRLATLCRGLLVTRSTHAQPETRDPAPHAAIGAKA